MQPRLYILPIMKTTHPLNQKAVQILKAGREQLRLTQKEFSAIVEYTPQSIADYEGSRATVPAGILLKLQELLSRHTTKKNTRTPDAIAPHSSPACDIVAGFRVFPQQKIGFSYEETKNRPSPDAYRPSDLETDQQFRRVRKE